MGSKCRATDSSQNALVTTADLKIPVGALTGAACNNISWNIPASTTPMVALNDLATGTYLGFQGGLYPRGSNVRPVDNDAAGLSIANSIQPLDANGNPDPNGKYGLISIGESNTSNTFSQFTINANANPSNNPHLPLPTPPHPPPPPYIFPTPHNPP